MYQRDYLLRMIEMMAELIAGILGLLHKGKFEEARETLNEAYTSLLKEDASFFLKIPANKLCHTLLQEHHYTHDHLKILAQLLKVEGDIHRAQSGSAASETFYKKALLLLEFLDQESGEYDMQRQAQIQKLKEHLASFQQ